MDDRYFSKTGLLSQDTHTPMRFEVKEYTSGQRNESQKLRIFLDAFPRKPTDKMLSFRLSVNSLKITVLMNHSSVVSQRSIAYGRRMRSFNVDLAPPSRLRSPPLYKLFIVVKTQTVFKMVTATTKDDSMRYTYN